MISRLLLLRRTSTASSRSQCSPLGPNSNQPLDQSDPRRTSTASSRFPAGPRPQAPDQSVPRRPSKLRIRVFPAGPPSSGSECSPPDLDRKLRIRVFPTGPRPPAPDQSVPHRTCTASSAAGPQPQRISEDIPDTMPKCQKICEIKCECQIECQKICLNKMSFCGDHSKKTIVFPSSSPTKKRYGKKKKNDYISLPALFRSEYHCPLFRPIHLIVSFLDPRHLCLSHG